jgi:hypothetical protein
MMNDPVEAHEPTGQSAPTKIPPLRIHHILIATTVTAVFLSITRTLERQDVLGFASFIRSNLGVLYAVCTSLALTGIGIGCYWRANGITFFHQPGHWLLVKKSLGIWILLLAAYSVATTSLGTGVHPGSVIGVFSLGTALAGVGISIFAALRIADSVWWKTLFTVEAVVAVGTFLWPLLLQFSPAVYGVTQLGMRAILLTLLVTVIVTDRNAHRERDWPHWLGVFIYITIYVAAIAADIGLVGLPK